MRGYLEITFGPMFSGKTSEMIRKMNRYLDAGGNGKVALVNFNGDIRECSSQVDILTSHATRSQRIHPKVFQHSVKNLSDVDLSGYKFVNIDESQFFDDLYPEVKKLVENGCIVHCCGLISDTSQNKFGSLLELFPLADKITQLFARCHCDHTLENKAPFTILREGKDKKEQKHVGSDIYIPVCGRHLKN